MLGEQAQAAAELCIGLLHFPLGRELVEMPLMLEKQRFQIFFDYHTTVEGECTPNSPDGVSRSIDPTPFLVSGLQIC